MRPRTFTTNAERQKAYRERKRNARTEPIVTLPEPYYQDRWVTLYCGDCTALLPHLAADIVITDPPYGVGMNAFNDDFTVAAPALQRCSGLAAAVFMSPRRVPELSTQLSATWRFERMLWMHKSADIAHPWHGWHMNGEAILLFTRARYRWPLPLTTRTDCYTVGPWERHGHPNGKPLSVVSDLVSRLSNAGDVVLDPFAGSGTTLVAAKRLGRRAIGIELDVRYCEIAAQRLCQDVMDLEVAA